MLRDKYGRIVTGIRISLTDRCNLSCFYCHREWNIGHGELNVERITQLAKVASSLGIRKLRITGGEPLLCDDLLNIVSSTSPFFEEVSMTTNGTMLKDLASELKRRGLKRVNVSLPTLSPERYFSITGKDLWGDAVKGIMEAKNAGLCPTKVNMVVLKGVNEDEVERMVDFAAENALDLQLIELQPIPDDKADVFRRFYRDLEDIEAWLANISKEVTVSGGRVSFRLDRHGNEITVTTVRPHGNKSFCSACSRLRVTADGKLKPCLLRNDSTVDLKDAHDFEELRECFLKAVSLREPYWK